MPTFNKTNYAIMVIGLSSALLSFSSQAAQCDYIIHSEWDNGFVAAIRITNTGTHPIHGWNVSWEYNDATRRTSGWNANVTGTNPYSASGVGWNDIISPGQSVEFGVQGSKASGQSHRPEITGNVCQSTSSHPSTSPPSSSSNSLTSTSSSSSSSSSRTSIFPSTSSLSSSSRSALPNEAPVSALSMTLHGLNMQLDASASYDPDGQALTHLIAVKNASGHTVASYTYPKVWVYVRESGDYEILHTVSDGTRSTLSTYPVTLTAIDDQPAVSAYIDYEVGAGQATLIANQYNANRNALTYEWDLGEGPVIGEPRQVMSVCKTPSQSRYRALVTVSNGDTKHSYESSITHQCGGLAKPRFSTQVDLDTLTVDASTSIGDKRFLWDLADGINATGITATRQFKQPGVYTITLEMEGQDSKTHSLSKAVRIPKFTPEASNNAPTLNWSVNTHGLTMHVNGANSSDPDGDDIWHTVTIKTLAGEQLARIPYHDVWYTLRTAGDYLVEYEVADSVSQTRESRVISVAPTSGNRAPSARVTMENHNTGTRLFADSSYDPDGDPITFEWDFGNGPFAGTHREMKKTCATALEPFNNRLILTVSDGELKNTYSFEASERCELPYAHDVISRAEFTYRIEGRQVSFDASDSQNDTGFLWDFGDGNTSTSIIPTHTYTEPGSYTVTLRVNSPLFSSTKTAIITIE